MQANIKELVEKLAVLGEDRDELNLWLRIFDDLEPDEQKKLLANLEAELTALERIKNSKP